MRHLPKLQGPELQEADARVQILRPVARLYYGLPSNPSQYPAVISIWLKRTSANLPGRTQAADICLVVHSIMEPQIPRYSSRIPWQRIVRLFEPRCCPHLVYPTNR